MHGYSLILNDGGHLIIRDDIEVTITDLANTDNISDTHGTIQSESITPTILGEHGTLRLSNINIKNIKDGYTAIIMTAASNNVSCYMDNVNVYGATEAVNGRTNKATIVIYSGIFNPAEKTIYAIANYVASTSNITIDNNIAIVTKQ